MKHKLRTGYIKRIPGSSSVQHFHDAVKGHAHGENADAYIKFDVCAYKATVSKGYNESDGFPQTVVGERCFGAVRKQPAVKS